MNEKLLSGLVSAAADEYFKDLYPSSSEFSNLDYNTRRLTELGTEVFGTNELNSALLGLGKLKADTIKGYGSTLGSYQSLTPGIRGQYMERIYNTPSAIFDYSLDTTQFTQGISAVGDSLTKLGLGMTAASSGFTLVNDAIYGDGIDFGDGFREGGYVATNAAFAASSFDTFKDITSLARLNPIGMLFTAIDIGLQVSPEYTIQYGVNAGNKVNGWTKAMYQIGDLNHANKQINPKFDYWRGNKF